MKKILFFLLVLASFSLSAQNEQMREMMRTMQPSRNVTDVPAENIQFWVGSGSNEVVAAFFFCANPEIGIAYGYRFNGTATILDMFNALDAADPNLTFTLTSSGYITALTYNNGTINVQTDSWVMYSLNGDGSVYSNTILSDGDYFELQQWDEDCTLPTTNIYYPVDPNAPNTPEDASIAASDIVYWVGNGNHEVVFSVVWADAALAWGYRFAEDSVTVMDIMDSIAANDWRFSYEGDGFISDIIYADATDTFRLSPHDPFDYSVYFNLSVNHVASMIGVGHKVVDGDFVKFADTYVSVAVDSTWIADWGGYWDYVYVWPQTIEPVSVPESGEEPQDATISADNIIYWVGNGDNEVVFAVNWCNPSEAVAWGVRFTGESALVADIMHTIELYDSRITFEGEGYISNITFADGSHDNYTPGMYWMYNVNGVGAMLGIDQQTVQNGDIIKFGDSGCGIDDGNWNYAWTTPIQPVELPAASTEVFDGIVGSEGCQAIKYDDPAILGWATTCVVTRGYQNIEQAGALANYGTDNDGVGASSESTTDGMVSLGDGGYAVLTFGMPITNGEGYDFAVFENSLNHTFLELAFVEVSSDGEHFYRFPSVSNTQTEQQIGNGGGVDATKLNNLAGKYIVGWGTPFDLEELAGYSNLDINNVTHVRIVDVVGSINPLYGTTDKNGHLINDPYPTAFGSGGFDLSGVAVMNGWTPTAVNNYQQEISFVAYPNPCQNVLNVNNVMANEPVSLFNAMGQLIWSSMTQDTYMQIDMQSYPAGIYMLQVGTQMTKIVKR